MKPLATVALMVTLFGCGPDRALISDTKFDAPLRNAMAGLAERDSVTILGVTGRCIEEINGSMRRDMLDAGAEVLTMQGETFTARVSSDDIFSLAGLEFVSRLQLSDITIPPK